VNNTQGKFPNRRYETVAQYFEAYRNEIVKSWSTIAPKAIEATFDILTNCIERDRTIFACGNGGSAAISNHLLCDFQKGIQTDTTMKPRVVSLASHLELITAIGNDIGYEEIFVYQLRTMARPGDVLVTISSSGNSENIVRAVQWAKDTGMATVALVGFDGGRSAAIADIAIHVRSHNYGTVEDVHQSMMHLFAQFIRQLQMSEETVEQHYF
jgi:D-sedoheptulose 7-phosphate isomerase